MTRRLVPTVLVLLALVGCSTPLDTSNQPAIGPTRIVTTKTRSLEIKVLAPGGLAVGGQILTDAGAGFLNGVGILTDAGAGLQPRGLLAAAGTFVSVPDAGVTVLGLDGKTIGTTKGTDAAGGLKLTGLPVNRTLSVVAGFKVDGTIYRLAAVVGADEFAGTLMLDPINTMVEARVRDVLAGSESSTLTNKRLQRVWAICNDANVTINPDELAAGRPLADITATLNAAWKATIDASVTSADEKAEITSFMADLKAIETAKP